MLAMLAKSIKPICRRSKHAARDGDGDSDSDSDRREKPTSLTSASLHNQKFTDS
ncbi:hypothetical protein GGE35_000578 [Rhizobium cellulosilyticum]|jgi:hypothetical protein|uniref:Uncharacterized protein n=1 Tax=Aliirhizobium cellulosilyticum TaxID=393664 RepID=A0A7W6UWS3_9HYPH|nr:hypothetical protein [Rhizobium cellulosilyticum]MBB4410109.1 hypothetical protein [Rhizobium cellulosilyticum]MBB4444796.1 hypothetical protein [Rhizobium cellulosilyticum]